MAAVFVRCVALAFFAFILSMKVVCADLNAESKLSIEWLVDSCDHIVKVYTKADSVDRSIESLKINGVLKTTPEASRADIANCLSCDRLFTYSATRNDVWLCFLRTTELDGLQLINYINLKHPRRGSYTAAITKRGEVLSSMDAILTLVKKRIAHKRTMPKRFKPLLLEALVRGQQHPLKHRHSSFSLVGMECFLGGFLHEVDCDKWSLGLEEYGGEHDLLITHLAVPADLEFQDMLIDKVTAFLDGQEMNDINLHVYALVNYPDDKTKKVLNRFAAIQSHGYSERPSLRQPISIARNVLKYWEFLGRLQDPINEDVVGVWRIHYGQTAKTAGELWHGENRTQITPTYLIEVCLQRDHSLSATAYSKLPEPETKAVWRGTGFWIASDNKLSITIEETTKNSESSGDSWAAANFRYQTLLKDARLDKEVHSAVEKSSGRVAEWIGPIKGK